MNRVQEIASEFLPQNLVHALGSETYARMRQFRSFIHSMIGPEGMTEIVKRYWDRHAQPCEPGSPYRCMPVDKVKADLNLGFRNYFPRIGVRAIGGVYTDRPKVARNHGPEHVVARDLKIVQRLAGETIKIGYEHVALLSLFKQGQIGEDELKKWLILPRKFIAAYLSQHDMPPEQIQRLRCRLTSWTNSGVINRLKRGTFEINFDKIP